MKPRIEVCLSPALLHLYNIKDAIVVIIDVFRATSTICAALDNGAKEIIPVDSVEKCIALGKSISNSITAGERDGKVADGLMHGNSPLEYPKEFIENKTLVLTTTNGTRLLHMCGEAEEIIIGSFLNLKAVCDYLLKQNKNVILGCASWKDRYNLEDSLFAGAVVDTIGNNFEMNCDSARASKYLYNNAKNNLYEFIKDSSHFIRLSKFGLEEDMKYCVTPNQHNVLPIYKDGKLICL